MNAIETIEKLDALTDDDPEVSHAEADDLLLDFLRENGHNDIALAWERARNRCGFWYA